MTRAPTYDEVVTPRWLTLVPRVAGALAAMVGATALIGWITGSEPLREFVPGLTSTRANTALCVALLGCALWQLGSPVRRLWPDRLARTAAAAAGVLALVTLCEYVAGTDIGIDELVFEDPAEVAFPGRISPQTATAIVLLAVPLLLPRARFVEAKQASAVAAAVIAIAALLGYAFSVAGSFGIADLSAMGVPGVVAVLSVATGILLLEPTRGVVGLFLKRTAGGGVARVLVPAALVIPVVLGLGLFVPETRGLISDGVAASLFVVSSMVAGATFVLLAARLLHKLDVEARATEARVAAEREELAARERAAVAVEAARLAAERATARIAFLQEATAALSQAASRDEVARAVLERAVPALGATTGAIGLGDMTGAPLLVIDDGCEQSAPEGFRQSLAATLAASPRTPIFVESEADARERFPELAPKLQAIGEAVALVPLTSGESTIGVLALGFADTRGFTHEDRALAVTLAGLCAQALERARLYEEERRVSLSLQHSLLGDIPRSVAGTDVTARYRPGVHELEVGGDWYQVIPLADGRLAFSVGDVVGRGLEAAAAMGQLRSAIAALTAVSSKPAEVLEALDRLATQVEGAQLATVVYGVLDPSSGELAYGCAGHLPPLVVLPEGRTWFLEEGRTTPLGVSQESLPVGARTTLPPEARLLLYTDGLVERRSSSLEAGLARLAEAAATACTDDPDALCDRILTTLLDDQSRRDDIALLCIARLPDCALARRAPAAPESLASLRRELGTTLRDLGIAADVGRDLVLASGEALANAVEHSASDDGPGEVLLQLDLPGAGELRVKVRDFGTWREGDAASDRGRGIALMRALADRVDIERRPTGTAVVLHKSVEVTHPLSTSRE